MEHYYEEECFTNFEEEFPAIVVEKINGNSFDTKQGGIIEYNDEMKDFATEFPAIVFNNTPDTTPPCEPSVCPPNKNKLDFRISCDESDDELHAIVYNDGLTSKSDLGIKPLVSSESTDEFNLINETSSYEYDEEIILRFNDLFNDIHYDNSKSKIDYDDNHIGIVQSSEGNENALGEDRLSETSHDQIIETFETRSFVTDLNIIIENYYVNGMLFFLIMNLSVSFCIPFDAKQYYKDGSHTKVVEAKELGLGLDMAPLPAADQRHQWLKYEIEGYTLSIVHSYELRLKTLWSRPVNRVYVLDFAGLTTEIRYDLAVRMRMVYFGEGRDFLGHAPSYVLIRDPVRRLYHRMIAYNISGRGQAPEKGRKSKARLSSRYFIGRLAMHYRLVSDEGLRGLQVVTRELPLIDLHELGRLHICTRYGNTWAWVAQGPKRQQAAVVGTPEVGEDSQCTEEVALEIPAPAPVQAPPPALQPWTMS
ncbi:hypothetical protein Tco_0604315 [Tanacetum coccineum]